MTIVEKAAYFKGLCDGMGVENGTREGKLWGSLCGLLSDMAHEIEELQQTSLDYAEALDEMSEDLSYLEELTCDLDVPEEMMEDNGSFCDGDCDSCDGSCGLFDAYGDEDMLKPAGEEPVISAPDTEAEPFSAPEPELTPIFQIPQGFGMPEAPAEEPAEEPVYDDDVVLYDVTCPKCGQEITFDEETLLSGSTVCPSCGEVLEFELGEE